MRTCPTSFGTLSELATAPGYPRSPPQQLAFKDEEAAPGVLTGALHITVGDESAACPWTPAQEGPVLARDFFSARLLGQRVRLLLSLPLPHS